MKKKRFFCYIKYIFYNHKQKRGNLVGDYNEVKKLQVLPKIKALVFLGNII
jgi:hypothetical protein